MPSPAEGHVVIDEMPPMDPPEGAATEDAQDVGNAWGGNYGGGQEMDEYGRAKQYWGA